MAVGFSVIVDDALIKKIEIADEKINQLATDSEAVRDKMIAAFKSMGDNGVQYLIDKLKEAQIQLDSLNGKDIHFNVTGLENLSTSTVKSVDDVNKLYEVITRLAEANEKLAGNIGSTATSLKELFDSFKNASENIDKLVKAEEQLVKINEVLTRMEKSNTTNKADNSYEKKLNILGELFNSEKARANLIEEITKQEETDHKKVLDLIKARAEANKADVVLEQALAKQKMNASLEVMIAAEKEANIKRQARAEEKKAAADITRSTKEYLNAQRLAAEQDRTATREAIAKEKEKQIQIQHTINEIKRLAKEYKQLPTLMTGDRLNSIMSDSSSAASINQKITAIKNLKNALKDLDTTDVKYKENVQKINDEIRRLTNELTNLGVASNNVRESHRQLMDVSGQLARKLALVFSVSQIQGYIKNLVNVRGEFELQQKSLQVLLQNRDEANKLWQQTVQLAVKSPFRVSELVSYTRQLAAYRIETSKLHETTRKLADVSAGLGVDMNRLILAYGQVRAAEYLRGTELRQFTEAGIPMLDELAKRFTELEGRAVSAGDVFERISKRMVGFEDVAAVFDKMTSAGGTFYKMQEEQAETLKGMISNLRDRFDLMMNDIGESNDGILKGSIKVANILVSNWQAIADIMKVVISMYGMYRLAVFASSEQTLKLAASLNVATAAGAKNLGVLKLLSLGLKSLGKSIKNVYTVLMANPSVLVTTAALAAVVKLTQTWYEHGKQIDDVNKKYQKLSDTANDITYRFNLAVDEKNYNEQRKRLQSLVDLANNEYHMNIKIDVQGLEESEISAKFNSLRQQLMEANTFAREFEQRMNLATFWKLDDDIFEDLNDLSEESESLKNVLTRNLSTVVLKLGENYDQLSEKQKDAYERLRKPIGKDESELQYIERLKSAYADLISEYTDIQDRIKKTSDRKELYGLLDTAKQSQKKLLEMGVDANALSLIFKSYTPFIKEAEDEYQRFINLNKDFLEDIKNLPESQRTFMLQIAIDKIAAEKHWEGFEKEYIQRWTAKEFEVQFKVVPPEPKPLEEWKDRYNKKFKNYEGFQTLDADSTREKVLQRINGLLSTQKDLVDKIRRAGTEDSAYIGMNLEYEEKKLKQLEAQRDFFGEKVSGEKKGQGKDWFSELANNIKAAHKEFVSLNKDLDKSAASSLMIERYSSVIHESLSAIQKQIPEFDISQYDLTDEDSTIKALSDLFNMLPDSAKAAKLNVQKALSDIIGEQTINNAKDQTTQLINGIKDMIDGYKLSIELEKLDVPQNLARDLFDVQTFNLDEIKARIAADKAADKEISKERLKQLEQLERQVADLEDKARMEKLKKYTKYLLQAQSETVKIKLDEVKQITEIESLNMTPDQKSIAKQAVREETQKKLDKQQWEDFKNTDMYIELFEELDNVSTKTLENMKEKLVEMRNSLNNLDPSQLKDITKRINDVDKELVTRNPFKDIIKSIKGVIGGYKKYKKAADAAMKSQGDVDNQQKIVDNLTIQVELQKKKLDTNQKGKKLTSQEYAIESYNLSLLTGQLDTEIKTLHTLKKKNEERKKGKQTEKDTYKISKDTLQSAAILINQQLSSINDIKDAWAGVFGGMSASLSDAFDSIQAIGGGITSIISGLSQGPTGYLQAAAGLMQVVGGIFNIGDKKKERQIQNEIEKVEDLQHAYEKLEKAINDAYAIDTLELSTKKAKANLQQQINSYNEMIAAEEAKKKTDKDRIKEWEYAIEDLQEQIKELNEEAFNKATGSIIDDVLSAANEFTDAWLSAFNEVGNGLSGLKDNFQDMMLNMIKQQASMLITQQYVNNWKKELERYINADDLSLTTDEAKKWVSSVTNSLPQLNDALTAYFEAMKAAGVDLTGESNLSGLAKGIASASEETMLAVEAYLNSIRFFVSEQNVLLQQIVASLNPSNTESPMVTQLKIIAQQTTAINTLLQSVSRGGHTMGGAGLKVFIN